VNSSRTPCNLSCMQSPRLEVMSSLAIREAWLELVPRFERESGIAVDTSWVGGVEIAKRLRAGATPDIVVLAAAATDGLIAEGLLASGGRMDLVRSIIGVAVRADAKVPDISSALAVRKLVEDSEAIAYSSGPSGVHLVGVFEEWGVAPSKLRQSAPGHPAGDLVARGEATIAFQQVSELLPVKGIRFVGALPQELQVVTVFSAGLRAGSARGGLARRLADFFLSDESAPVLRRHGLEPA